MARTDSVEIETIGPPRPPKGLKEFLAEPPTESMWSKTAANAGLALVYIIALLLVFKYILPSCFRYLGYLCRSFIETFRDNK